MAHWAVVGVQSRVAWPTSEIVVEFRGRALVLRPGSDSLLPSVAFEYGDSMAFDDAILFIRHFLSSLSWVERQGIEEVATAGAGFAIRLGRPGSGGVVTNHFRHDYLPDPSNPEARLALAFFREGVGHTSAAARFLSLFKIINIKFSAGRAQIDWINDNLAKLRGGQALERLAELRLSEKNIGKYLYESGRCAVAHAYAKPLIDPENVEDGRRLHRDLPVAQAIAELFIEQEFGVQSRESVWRAHLYHLEGFHPLFGDSLVTRLKRKEQIDLDELPELPDLTIGVRDAVELPTFSAMAVRALRVEGGALWLLCESRQGAAQLLLGLDFAEELLLFNPEENVAVFESDTQESRAAQNDHLLLLRGLLLNGQLQILRAATGERIGRTDAYIGRNIDMNSTLANIDRLLESLETRDGPSASAPTHAKDE